MLFNIYNHENTNKDIVKYMGHWDIKMAITDLVASGSQSLDLEVRLFAGSKIIDFNKGAYQLGLIYNFGSSNMNPVIYLQRFDGYSESLLDYNQRHTEYRLGFMLSY